MDKDSIRTGVRVVNESRGIDGVIYRIVGSYVALRSAGETASTDVQVVTVNSLLGEDWEVAPSIPIGSRILFFETGNVGKVTRVEGQVFFVSVSHAGQLIQARTFSGIQLQQKSKNWSVLKVEDVIRAASSTLHGACVTELTDSGVTCELGGKEARVPYRIFMDTVL